MSKDNSPMYARGVDDAMADNERVANGNDAIGPTPPNPAYPVMYNKGYNDHFSPNPPGGDAE